MPPLVSVNCQQCEIEFQVKASRLKAGRGKYCSRACRGKGSAGQVNKRYEIEGKNRIGEPFLLDGDWVVPVMLTRGKSAIVDVDSVPLVANYSWYCTPAGYAKRTKKHLGSKQTICLHNVILPPPEGFVVDHMNSNPLDCRKKNLRVVTPAQNGQNMWGKPGASGVRGVYLEKSGRWAARLGAQGKQIHLGIFATIEEANAVVIEGRKKLLPFSIER